MSRSLLFVLLAFGMALAGCTSNLGGTPSAPSSTGASSPAQAQALLAAALQSPPDRFHVTLAFYKGTDLVATANATYLNDTKESYIEAGGALLARATPMGSLPFTSLTFYKGPAGIVAQGGGMALVLPPANASGQSSMFLNQARGSGLGPFFEGGSALAYLEGDHVSVQTVEPTTCAGQPALRVVFNHTVTTGGETQQNVALADVLPTTPARLCHLETTLPARANAAADPMSGASLRADFLYDANVPAIPTGATGELGLRYVKSDATSATHQAWTFSATSGRRLADVAVEVKQPANNSQGGMGFSFPNYATQPTAWSMTLDQKTMTQGGVTLTFDDKDGDGKVSAGDTLTLDAANGDLPTVVLKDLTTNTYVVPGPGLALGLVMLGLAALVIRRRV